MANPPGSSLGWVKIDPHVEVSSPEWRTITPSGRDRQVTAAARRNGSLRRAPIRASSAVGYLTKWHREGRFRRPVSAAAVIAVLDFDRDRHGPRASACPRPCARLLPRSHGLAVRLRRAVG